MNLKSAAGFILVAALLAREVDHRARNALAVVQSIIRLTRAQSDGGRVHNLLRLRVAGICQLQNFDGGSGKLRPHISKTRRERRRAAP